MYLFADSEEDNNSTRLCGHNLQHGKALLCAHSGNDKTIAPTSTATSLSSNLSGLSCHNGTNSSFSSSTSWSYSCSCSARRPHLKPMLPSAALVFGFFALILFSALTSTWAAENHEIHKRMTENDLRKVFQVHSHEEVPDYDVVQLRVISKRSAEGDAETASLGSRKQVALTAFGKTMHLNLKPNSDFNQRIDGLKFFMAESQNNGKLKYVEDKNAESKESMGQTYHDDKHMAALLLRHASDGKLLVDGTIGNNLVIKPVPFGMDSPGRDDDEMFLDEDEASQRDWSPRQGINTSSVVFAKKRFEERVGSPKGSSSTDGHHQSAHFVYKRKVHEGAPHTDFLELESDKWTNREPSLGLGNKTSEGQSQHQHHRSKRQSPDTVWPEVLLVVDYDSYMLHGGNSRDVKRYFISFWNGVDLRYKLLSHPRIRVSLAGMIVAKDRDATPYLERNRLRSPNADAVDAAGALTDMGKYLYREDRLPTYDLAVVITKLDMCRRRYEGGRCNRGTAGFAYVGGACVVNKRLEKVNSVAIIEDSGGFSGIIVAAHEVGHLLGCVHDGSPPPSYLGGPGATRCPWEDGFIMSDLRHTERGFRWSSCSVEQFKHFLNGETATCLYNYPHENQLLPRVLPGTMLSLDEQCKRDRGTNACFKDARVCAQLFCFDSASGYCVSYRPAAEGSACGDGQVCRNGKCSAELENIIPDYTHVTQVVSRAQPGGGDRLLSRSDTGHTMATPPQSNLAVVKPRPQQQPQPQSQRFRSRNLGRSSSAEEVAPQSGGVIRKKSCRDMIDKMAGSLSCTDFLDRFGYRYCNHNYVKKNCCASHAIMCNKETL